MTTFTLYLCAEESIFKQILLLLLWSSKFCFCDQYIANIEISAINLIDKIRANLVHIAAYQEGNTLSSPSAWM